MRQRRILLALCAAFLVGGFLLASASDPLISLSYLTGLFADRVDSQLEEKLDLADQIVYDAALASAEGAYAAAEAVAGINYAPALTEAILKEGDVLAGSTGLICLPLSGEVKAVFDRGAVVDVTDGAEIVSGTVLTTGHKYMAAEDAAVRFTVVSPVAVVSYEGRYAFSLSDKVDYAAMADALRALNLFQGTGTAYGKGYSLEKTPTRLQALVMFLRIMGEEEAALAYTGSHRFNDVRWGDNYVAYAVDKGYTDGVSPDRFGADSPASSVMFMEFLLRAMNYSKVGVDNWATSLERAQLLGIITKGEYDLLKNETFLRAQVVYLSYYSLDAVLPSGQTLADRLIGSRVFTSAQLREARALVPGQRIS